MRARKDGKPILDDCGEEMGLADWGGAEAIIWEVLQEWAAKAG